jgi:hypothetical protein
MVALRQPAQQFLGLACRQLSNLSQRNFNRAHTVHVSPEIIAGQAGFGQRRRGVWAARFELGAGEEVQAMGYVAVEIQTDDCEMQKFSQKS